MRVLITAILMLFAASPALAADWTVDMGQSHLKFQGTQTGGKPFQGEFSRFTAAISFDPEALDAAKAHVEVDLKSADSGDKQRDAMMQMKDWLDVRASDKAIFETTAFQKMDDGSYAAEGNLTLRGVTRPVTLPFTLTIDGDTAHAVGQLTLHRADFGLGGEKYADDKYVGLDVNVIVDLVATK